MAGRRGVKLGVGVREWGVGVGGGGCVRKWCEAKDVMRSL